jgi:hypothetical protein
VNTKKSTKRSAAKAVLLAAILSLGVLAVGYTAVRSADEAGEAPAQTPSPSENPSAGAATPAASAGKLSDASPSVEALARRVVSAVAAGDRKALALARVTEKEFRELVWPELPASKVPNVTADFAWSQASLHNHAGFERVLENHRGRIYEVVAIRFLGGVTSYKSFKVHNKSVLTVRDETGAVRDVRLFGSVLELDGQYKLFSYVAD